MLQTIVAALAGIVTVLVDFYTTYQAEIDKLVLRVEKDSEDGWTSEDKQAEAEDIYLNIVKSRLPLKLKMVLAFVPDNWEIAAVRKLIEKICKKSAELKQHIEASKAAEAGKGAQG